MNFCSFCHFGHAVDRWLTRQGAKPLFKLIEVDNANPKHIQQWYEALAEVTASDVQHVEIQKQLSLDFANRIVEKQQALRASRQRISRERASRKEQAIESIGKFGSNIVKAFDKVAAPAKSIFQRILDFFSIIVTGLIVNNAFNWISKKENVS